MPAIKFPILVSSFLFSTFVFVVRAEAQTYDCGTDVLPPFSQAA